ncbi:nicotinamide mononucleotide transporter family protein [Streptomyces sp. PTM05]|uniref:Nicotinamide mononucleotide transporter family protein n=1 Tax=Streptantibioticus parmotrematis TaxID=2873249 RepID=A0ABS7QM25_9ACTN|nr:nicotinamide mononucleotide transporter family protein [Streptantibioticus parmotrematis]MBY8884241.1 nicotinamide mononucleotide transporter family protein [Streptantibioticus parmotrematis]
MSSLDSLNSVAFSVFGEHVKWADMTGNLLGLAGLALGWRRALLAWPVQLLSGAVLVIAYWSAHLTGGVGKQLLVVVVAAWGWIQWRRGRRESGQVEVRFATWRERGWLVGGTAVGTLAVVGLFTLFPSLSWNPWPDAYIFVGTLAAMVAMARGWVEFWFAWLAVDLVGVPLAWSSDLKFSALVYVIYFVLVLLGLRAWWLRTRTSRPDAGALEGAPA